VVSKAYCVVCLFCLSSSCCLFLWIVIFLAVFVWSAICPLDRFTWFLEVAPALLAFFVLAITHKRFPLTQLAYILILLHCIILMIGGHYTYAEVPIFNEIKDFFNHQRNNYDKIGHFAQGFVPAIIAREIIVRNHVIENPKWQVFFILCFCLALSALYELLEYLVSVLSGQAAEAFLGTQGSAWDTQSDMAFALIGAISSLLLLYKYHDKQLMKVGI